MTSIAIGSIFAVTLVGIAWAIKKLPGGCWGECRQGRGICNCKGDQK